MEDAYKMADMTAIPLRAGSGIKIKTLESLAFGKATILSNTAAQGVELETYPQRRISSDPRELTDEIIETLDNQTYKRSLIQKGLEIIKVNYNPEKVYAQLKERLSQI